jgi:hypothetical protein
MDTRGAADSQLTPRRNIPVARFRQSKVDRDGDRRGGDGFKCSVNSTLAPPGNSVTDRGGADLKGI